MPLVEPDSAVLMRAEAIAISGEARSGQPALQYAIYHALALELGGTLATADRTYAGKVEGFGVVVLEDWVP